MAPPAILETVRPATDAAWGLVKLPLEVLKAPAAECEPALLHRSLIERPLSVASARGSFMTLGDGRLILDGCGGAAVAIIGHGNKEVMAATIAQMKKVSYVHTLSYTTGAAENLAKFLLNDPKSTFKHGLVKAYFVNSGSEATDTALKMGRQYFFEQGRTERKHYVSRRQAYHGNTIGAMSVSTNTSRKIPYDSLAIPNVSYVSPAYAYQYKHTGESEEEFCRRLVGEIEAEFLRVGPTKIISFIAEPIVGATAGCVPPPKGYFTAIRKLCDKYGILLHLDEVMCGTGRTGTYFACEQDGVMPDIVTVGKGLGGGYAPIAAVLVSEKVINVLRQGTSSFNHGHTYQAHPTTCATALAVQQIVRRDGLVDRCAIMGQRLERILKDALSDCKYVGDIRGRGLFWGVEFVKDKITKSTFPRSLRFGLGVQQAAFEMGVAVYPGSGTVDGVNGDHILIAPPYNVAEGELMTIVQVLRKAYDLQQRYVDELYI